MCDTLLRVLGDRVLFAKNSDREADEPQRLEWHAAREHAPAERVQCTWISIPQAERTFATLLSRPFWMWGAEMGANEHGVVIGNEAVFTQEPVPAEGGLTGMDLLRHALERAPTAEEAVQVITTLHERHGQGGRCGYEDRGFRYFSSFAVADARQAWVVETAGREWATEKVEGARTISNGLTIPGFAEKHGDFLKTRISACAERRARTTASAASAASLSDLLAALRDHGDAAWPRYSAARGAMHAPCMHAGGLIAASQTTGSLVAELSPGGARLFATGTSAPCVSVFKPVRVGEPLDLGPAPGAERDESLWWTHERLHRAVMRNPARLAPLFVAERDAMEARFVSGNVGAAEAWEEAGAALRSWIDRVEGVKDTRDVRRWAVRRYWAKRR
ncbi:MAG TPA: carcinine hydrolase/isopenicillin-N N-acyltransferase family protein [Usitatibacter sp.]|nr:carcinine hydrolase/isopenicillin-N N-acyltransferase family protein [Usitatibacter sp.]